MVQDGDILISMTGSHMSQINSAVGKIGRYNHEIPAFLNQRVGKLKAKFECSEYLYRILLKEETKMAILMAATGSANQANISPDTIKSIKIIKPSKGIVIQFDELVKKINKHMYLYQAEIRKLDYFKTLLLSKLATIESIKPELATV